MSKTFSPRLALTAVTGLALFVPLAPASAEVPAVQTLQSADPTYEELPLTQGSQYSIAQAQETKPFGLVGVTWPYQKSSAQVQVRIRVQRDGQWTAWENLLVEDDHGPAAATAEGNQRSGTEPYWVGTANGVQTSLTTLDGTKISGAKVVLINPGVRPADSEPPTIQDPVEAEAARAPYAMPAMVSRRAWGADERLRAHNGKACVKPKYTGTVQAAFVHHTADRNNYTRTQVPAMVRSMYAYHVKSRGWCDLGYNFLVDRFGRAFEGRYGGAQLPVLGAHTGAFNANSFGVSLIGNFDQVAPPAPMLETTARIIAWKLDANYRSPLTTVVLAGSKLHTVSGHRDTKATACPGKNLYSKLPWLKQRTNILMGKSVSTEIYRYAKSLGGFRVTGQPFWGEHRTKTGRATYFSARDIYWSKASGAHSVTGLFRTRYRQLGPDGLLGLPTTEYRVGRVSGSKVQNFQNGGLYWSKRTAMRPVAGMIHRKYAALGAERSRLGLPTTDMYPVKGGLRQKFQRGALTFNSRDKKVYVS
ncbi:N-acetylmuramoyl-L-alanine amidase [Kribbella sp. CA-293567]|uniref:N-acetylmuramoyl-L-alanine amidase n=1 Tax=Kribbella sp. CA-293567 TaxID=3002436 RepID=UPI0022DE4D63|nr:N-acetylmuramoyl-L-alanine amidase [Kribbella sp. CA-293567]WBQ04089.1 N-acetylmuramoyl-L-alanine amidase [Kribbella sp. CA-293567]